MMELERQLLALRDEVAWPATPDLAAGVQARITREPRPERSRERAWLPRRLAPAVVVVLIVLLALGTLLAASPSVRATLREWLGIGAVSIQRVHRLPDLAPARTLDLGRRVTAAQAQRHLGHSVATVRALGTPDAIYAGDAVVPATVSLVYAPRAGLPASTPGVGALLDEVGADSLPFIQKLVHAGTPIVAVNVNGVPGLFIAGKHALGLPDELKPRMAGNTVVWVRDGITYRLETALGRRAALRLARSVR